MCVYVLVCMAVCASCVCDILDSLSDALSFHFQHIKHMQSGSEVMLCLKNIHLPPLLFPLPMLLFFLNSCPRRRLRKLDCERPNSNPLTLHPNMLSSLFSILSFFFPSSPCCLPVPRKPRRETTERDHGERPRRETTETLTTEWKHQPCKKSSDPNTLFILYSFSRLYYLKINVHPGAFRHNTTLYEGRSSVTGCRMQGCPGLGRNRQQTPDQFSPGLFVYNLVVAAELWTWLTGFGFSSSVLNQTNKTLSILQTIIKKQLVG